MRVYLGERREDGCLVEVLVQKPDGTVTMRQPLDPHFDLAYHSPTGFEWSYCGSGPAQLALAILVDCIGAKQALIHYQQFKADVIAALPRASWRLEEKAIREWHGRQNGGTA